jgi:hypothetical protein
MLYFYAENQKYLGDEKGHKDQMNRYLVFFYFLIASSACLAASVAQQDKVPLALWEKIKATGMIRVLVHLNIATVPRNALSKEKGEQEAINAAQTELLTELAQVNHRVTARYKNIPGIGLEVGPDALGILERSKHVTRVSEDRPLLKPSEK